ncbi:MAG: hypothetical protein ACKO8Q_10025, partial [Bacteroidota bacterium]
MKTQSILTAIAFLIIQATAAQITVRFSKDLKFADSLNTFYASVDKCNAIRNYYGIGEELDFVSAQNQIEIHNWNYNKEGVNEEGKLVFLTSNKEKIVYSGNVEFEVLGASLFSEPQFSIDGLNWEALQSNYINVFPAVGDTTVSLFIKGVSEGDEWSVGIEIPIQRSSEIMPDESPWPLDNLNFPYEQVVEFEGEEVRGNVYTKLSEDGIFDKPFIFIEGIDFGNQRGVLGNGTFGWDDLVGGYTEGQYGMLALMPIFLDSILERGHDLVFIDFADGAEDIKKNAALVRKIISLCNEYKVGTVENIIAGASMGGIVARVALREMELSNICHNCSNNICLDS